MSAVVPPLASLLGVLVDCACQLLADNERPVCDCCIVHAEAQIPMDGCDCNCEAGGGRLSARVAEVLALPNAAGVTTGPCSSTLIEATVELGVFRCITVPEPTAAPDCDTLTVEAMGFLQDEMILRAAVSCCDTSKVPGRWTVGADRWTPRGPEGGCAGGVLTVVAQGIQRIPAALNGGAT